ncbi:ABC transporter ATP-binding protein [Mechercharimyces sp. CAU 1602]|uniref:ABC transporter ATP-binding protein n=1 Tax=Mechercharimyces sp. CAU 1602 TaxID=2973933 RepID=UPI0021621C10|nr:ABC transporter ATP-binding protein [Mechercharimyces sp. CAU 1602]MCS1351446.1 ABC transporter ATP-binding protein [Mechercharimyces sp. CAU 1602]
MLHVNQLVGGYQLHKPVIHDISFTVRPHEMVGIIGLNGAGKSTTIKHILGLLNPSSGEITLDNVALGEDPVRYRSSMAYIPETPQLYDELTLMEHLELTAQAYQIDQQAFAERIPALLETFRMTKQAKWFPGVFSKGMQQKVMILCAFLVQPSLLIADEPFVGLDPLATQALLDHFVAMKEAGAGILLSTHILSTAEKYCDRFVLLHEGRVQLHGTLAQMQAQAGRTNASLDELFRMVTQGEG